MALAALATAWKQYDHASARAWVAVMLSVVLHVRVVPAALHGLPNALYVDMASQLTAAAHTPSRAAMLTSGASAQDVSTWSPLNVVRALVPGTVAIVLPDALWLLALNAPALCALLTRLHVVTKG